MMRRRDFSMWSRPFSQRTSTNFRRVPQQRVDVLPDLKTLGALLRARGLNPEDIVATRNTLHPDDVCADFKDIGDVVRADALSLLDRMQDGPRIANDTLVLSFAAVDETRARLTGFRRFMMRRAGIVPGDIVYHYDAAHLLHSFMARAINPTFYDAQDEDGLADVIEMLVIDWPAGGGDMLPADDTRLAVVES
jgi:hypothetical protein